MTIEKLLEAIKENRAVFGASVTLKLLKANEIEEVYLTSNCSEHMIEQIEQIAKTNKISVNNLKENNEELAVLCKKPFSISIASIRKVKEKE